MTRLQALARAIAWREQGIYDIGHGNGNHPDADTPLDAAGKCDCSNLVHWIIGSVLNRGKNGYYNTDGMLYDAYGLKRGGGKDKAPQRVFTTFEGDAQPLDLIVSPGTYEMRNGKLYRVHAGHTGIVTQVMPRYSREMSFEGEGYSLLRFVHCSTFGTKKPPAIRETDGRPWRTNGYLMRYKDFTGE